MQMDSPHLMTSSVTRRFVTPMSLSQHQWPTSSEATRSGLHKRSMTQVNAGKRKMPWDSDPNIRIAVVNVGVNNKWYIGAASRSRLGGCAEACTRTLNFLECGRSIHGCQGTGWCWRWVWRHGVAARTPSFDYWWHFPILDKCIYHCFQSYGSGRVITYALFDPFQSIYNASWPAGFSIEQQLLGHGRWDSRTWHRPEGLDPSMEQNFTIQTFTARKFWVCWSTYVYTHEYGVHNDGVQSLQ